MTDEVAGVEFVGVENDGLENDGVDGRSQTHSHCYNKTMKEFVP